MSLSDKVGTTNVLDFRFKKKYLEFLCIFTDMHTL